MSSRVRSCLFLVAMFLAVCVFEATGAPVMAQVTSRTFTVTGLVRVLGYVRVLLLVLTGIALASACRSPATGRTDRTVAWLIALATFLVAVPLRHYLPAVYCLIPLRSVLAVLTSPVVRAAACVTAGAMAARAWFDSR